MVKPKRGKTLRVTLVVLCALVAACVVGFFAYTSDYYRADETALEVLANEGDARADGTAGAAGGPETAAAAGGAGVSGEVGGAGAAGAAGGAFAVVNSEADGVIAFVPQEPKAGLVFYPGGKVEYTAYAPLMAALAERGIMCALVEMPFNLAVFDVGAAADARALVQGAEWASAAAESANTVGERSLLAGISPDQIANMPWYVGGHSLGGSMAASFVADHATEYAGLVLFASYSTEDLSGLDLEVVSVYGSNDQVLNRDSYAEYLPNLGEEFAELVIEGGNHAQFGSYGSQEGDGEATVSAGEQMAAAADFVAACMVG